MSLPEGYSIRLFLPGDEAILSALTVQSIKRLGLRHYSTEQVRAWAARIDPPERFADRVAAGAIVLVALAKHSLPVAYTLVEADGEGDAHLDMLYCHPQHTRQGLADALLAKAEDCSVANKSRRIYAEASELARPAFERAGYTLQHRRDFAIELDGKPVPIHNYALEKRLI